VPIPRDVDQRIAAVIAACWRLDPEQRPSADSLAVLLERWGTPEWGALAQPLLAPPPTLSAHAEPGAELLHAFRGVVNLPVSWNTATPLAQWEGVKLSPQGAITDVDLYNKQLSGHVDLTVLPATLTALSLIQNQLSGHVDLTKLPPTLRELSLYENAGLTGAVDLTKLPATLKVLRLDNNQLTGPVDLTQLPATLQTLDLEQNQLAGAVDLASLPATLEQLWLCFNQLSGPVDLTSLPASLDTLDLRENAGLTGVWRGEQPSGFHFDGTGITVAGA
jgi:hypothetical protein